MAVPESVATASLRRDMLHRTLVLDGAMATFLQSMDPTEAVFRGDRFSDSPLPLSGNFDVMCLTQPERVLDVHRAYLHAGADIIRTNSFSSSRVEQARYGLATYATEMTQVRADPLQVLVRGSQPILHAPPSTLGSGRPSPPSV